MSDCEEKTETVASPYSHFYSNLVEGQDPPSGRRLQESAARWLGSREPGCVGGSLPPDIMSHKKDGMQLYTLQMLILLMPVTFPSIIMELCWSHVFPARRTGMKS